MLGAEAGSGAMVDAEVEAAGGFGVGIAADTVSGDYVGVSTKRAIAALGVALSSESSTHADRTETAIKHGSPMLASRPPTSGAVTAKVIGHWSDVVTASVALHLNLNLNTKVLDFVKSGGLELTEGRTVFELRMGL